MLTLTDCMDMCDVSKDEIMAIAEHEHIPEIIATEMAGYLAHTPEGVPVLKRFIIEDIQVAHANNDEAHAKKLDLVLKHFIAKHPELAIE